MHGASSLHLDRTDAWDDSYQVDRNCWGGNAALEMPHPGCHQRAQPLGYQVLLGNKMLQRLMPHPGSGHKAQRPARARVRETAMATAKELAQERRRPPEETRAPAKGPALTGGP